MKGPKMLYILSEKEYFEELALNGYEDPNDIMKPRAFPIEQGFVCCMDDYWRAVLRGEKKVEDE